MWSVSALRSVCSSRSVRSTRSVVPSPSPLRSFRPEPSPKPQERSVELRRKPRMLAYSPSLSLDGRLRRLSVFIRSVLCGEQECVSSLPWPGDIPFFSPEYPVHSRSFPVSFTAQGVFPRSQSAQIEPRCVSSRRLPSVIPSFLPVLSALSEMSDSGRRDPRKMVSQQLFIMPAKLLFPNRKFSFRFFVTKTRFSFNFWRLLSGVSRLESWRRA